MGYETLILSDILNFFRIFISQLSLTTKYHRKMFEVKQKEGSDGYHFVLKAKNGQVILSSQGYANKAGAMNGVESVKKNAADDSKFERKTAKNGKFYFNLKAANSQIIGTSQMYAGEAGMENGIQSIKNNAPGAECKEV